MPQLLYKAQRTHGAEPIIAKGISCRLGPLLSAGLRFAPGESAINKGIKAESARSFSCCLSTCECLCFVLAGPDREKVRAGGAAPGGSHE